MTPMNARRVRAAVAALLGLFVLLVCQAAQAEAWVQLTGPVQTVYTAPATYQFQINTGVIGTGHKAEYLTDIKLSRNGTAVSRIAAGTHTENGISAGIYDYQLTAVAIRNVDGDEFRRQVKSQVVRITVEAPPAPFDGAEYVSSNLRVSADRGTPFSGTVTFRNTGNTTWRAADGHRLAQAQGDLLDFGVSDIPVPYDVAPGGTVGFTVNAVAPNENGEHGIQWQMNRNGVRFGTTGPAGIFTVTGRLNRGVMYSQEVPTTMEAGRSYKVTLRFVNSGNTTWSASNGYALGSWNPENNSRWGVARVPMPNNVLPQGPAIFEFNVVAPSLPGVYGFQWRLLEENVEWFGGESTNVQVTVTGPPSRIVGNIDAVTSSGEINGWACSTGISAPIDVHVYGGGPFGVGTILATGKADQSSEPAVATACGAAGNHRFSIPLSNEVRRQRAGQSIHVHGISPVGQPNSTIAGSGSFVVPAAPTGSLSVSPASCQIPAGATTCNVRLAWSATDPRAEVRSGAGALIGTGASGALDVGVGLGNAEFVLSVVGDVLARASASGRNAPIAPGNPDNPVPTVTRRYVYDENLRLCKVIEPETGSTVFGYDQAGNIAWSAGGLDLPSPTSCDRGDPKIDPRRVERAYDANNRLLSVVYPDGLGDQTLTYSAAGEVESETVFNQGRVAVVTARSYNSLGSVVSQSRIVGSGQPRTLVFGYNSTGQHVRTDYPDGYSVHQSLNGLGEAVRLQDGAGGVLVSNVTHSPSGKIALLTYGNGIQRSVEENARQVTSRVFEPGVVDLRYSYDPSGNIAQIVDGVRGEPGRISLGYDRLDRLTQASAPAFGGSGNYTFGYDTVDNIVSMRLPGARERTFHYDSRNRLELLRDENTSGVEAFTYDAAGNLSLKNGKQLLFDIGAQLRSVDGGEDYFYDGAGLRVRASGVAERTWQHLVGGELIESTTGDETSDYIYLGSQLVAIRSSTPTGVKLTYLHHDALNNLVATSDAAGTVLARHLWSPYGEPDSPPDPNVPGFSGHLGDVDTGFIYMGRRYYDPMLARFISPDPLAASTSGGPNLNRYRYANNNPFGFSDPTGACDQVTGSRVCNSGGFAGDRVETTQYAAGSIPVYDPNAAAPAPREAATGLDAIAAAFTERNWFVGQGSLTDFDAVSEGIVVPLMNSPGGAPVVGGVKVASFVLVAVRVEETGRGFANLSRAGAFGLGSYTALRRAVGKGSSLQVHHLIEKRFADVLGVKKGEMLSVVVTKAEHQVFTNQWRAAFPYGREAPTQQQILQTAKKIYQNHTAILDALGL
nr:RHS repeat-associated core domain-containing protein [Stenotrophomonas sp. ISL-67]